MRILVLSQYFWPEHFIINDIVRLLSHQGHEVTVATGKPNYPEGVVFDGYRAWGCQRERYLERIEVVRVPLWARRSGGARNLVLNYLSFVAAGLLFFPWLLRRKRFDAILVFAPSPITQAIPAIVLKWLKGATLALWIQDLWPESLAATGFVKNLQLLRAVGWMVKAIYYGCDLLLVQSRAFVVPVAQYAQREKIVYFPNSIDAERHPGALYAVPETLLHVLESRFCVVFAGNLGTAQALDTLVQAAALLRDNDNICLVLVGSGSRLEWLKEQKRLLGLDNLMLPGRFPADAMPLIFQRSGALLVSLNDEEIFAQTVPSKLQAYLAAGRPIIASLNGEGASVVQEAAAGFVSPAGKEIPLAENIRRMAALSEAERAAMGQSGRDYFEAHFEMQRQVRELVGLLTR